MPPAVNLKEAQAFVIAQNPGDPQSYAFWFIDPSNRGRKMRMEVFAKNILKVAPLANTDIDPDDINKDLVINVIKMPDDDDAPDQQPIVYNVTLGILLNKFLPKTENYTVGIDVPATDGNNYMDFTGVLDLSKIDILLMLNNGIPQQVVLVTDAGDDNKIKIDFSNVEGMTSGVLTLLYQPKLI